MTAHSIMYLMDGWDRRLIEPEFLDSAPEKDRTESLRDLVRINRYLGGHRILRSLLREFAGPRDAFTLLDVGAASGDMGNAVRRAFPGARVVSLDRSEANLRAAPHPRLAADALSLPFQRPSFDFVFCSLFLHHFEDAVVTRLLSGFAAVARRAVIVVDLERGPFAHRFIPATRHLFGWNAITVHDAPVSVRAAFRESELLALAHAAGLDRVRVRKHRPWCRLSLVARMRGCAN